MLHEQDKDRPNADGRAPSLAVGRALTPIPETELQALDGDMAALAAALRHVSDPQAVAWEELTPEEISLVREAVSEGLVAENFRERIRKGFVAERSAASDCHRLDERGESIDMMLSAVRTLARRVTQMEPDLAKAIERAARAAADKAAPSEEPPVPQPAPEPAPAPTPAVPPKLSISDNQMQLLGVTAQMIEEAAKEALAGEEGEKARGKDGSPGWLSRLFRAFRGERKPAAKERNDEPSDEQRRPSRANDRERPGMPSSSSGQSPSAPPGKKDDTLSGASRFPSQRFAQTGKPEMEDMQQEGTAPARSASHRSEASLGRLGDKGQVLSHDQKFLASLGVTDIYVVAGRSGELMRLDRFIKLLEERGPSPDNPTFDELFPARRVPAVERVAETRYGVPYPGVAQCRFKLKGAPSVSLPLSPRHKIMALSYADASGNLMEGDGPTTVREGLFGSCLVRPPEGAAQIIYQVVERIREGGSPRLVEKLRKALPVFPSYLDEEGRAFRQALEMVPMSSADAAAIWYDRERERGYIYTMNKLVISYQEGAGQGFDEAISGTRMGICDSFAYHLARGCVSLGAPAFSIVGALPKGEEKTFQFNPGHAQTLVYAEEGARVLDLTAHTLEASLSSWRVGRSEKRELFGRLGAEDATNRTVYETGEHLAARLRGLPPPGSGEEAAQPLGFWGRRYEEHGLRESTIDDASLTYSQAQKRSIVEAIEHQLIFQERCEELERSGSLARARSFLGEKPLPAPSPAAVMELPERLGFVKEYDPMEKLAAFSKEAVLNEEISDPEKRETIRWVLDGMDPDRTRRSDLLGGPPPGEPEPHPLDLRRILTFLGPDTIALMTPREAAECLVSLLPRVSDWLYGKDSSRWLAGRELPESLSALEALAGRLAGDGFPIPDKAKLECAAQVARLAGRLCVETREKSKPPAPPIDRLASIFSDIDRIPGSPAAKNIWSLHMIADDEVARGLKAILTEKARLHFFADPSSIAKAGEAISGEIADQLMERMSSFADYGARIESIERAGFPLDLSPWREALTKNFLSSIRDRLAQSADAVPNLPGPGKPASTLYLEHSRIEASFLHRTSRAVTRLGGALPADLERAWPERPETEVGAQLLSALFDGNDLEVTLTASSTPEAARYDLANCAKACSDLAADHLPLLPKVVRHLEKCGHYAGEEARLLTETATLCPEEWHRLLWRVSSNRDSWVACVVGTGVAKKLFTGRTPPEAYHALIVQAGDGLACEWGKMERLAAKLDETRPGEPLAKGVLEDFGGGDLLARQLGVSDEDRLAALALRAALLVGENAGFKYDPSLLGSVLGLPEQILSRLLVPVPPAPQSSQSPYGAVWARLTRIEPKGTKALRAAQALWVETASRAARVLEADNRLRAAPFARYMQHETGRVLPITSGGEIEELRQYTPGDDARTIVWSASARLDKLVVKRTREEEVRPVKLVIDMEWLAADMRALEKGERAKRLERVFNQIIMADEQGVRLDVAFVQRTPTAEFERVIATDSGRGIYAGSEEFVRALVSGMAGSRLIANHENSIYGEAPRPRYNVLIADEIEFRRDSIAVFALSEPNSTATEPALRHLTKRGVYVAAVRRHSDDAR